MTIQATCPSCDREHTLADDMAGKKIRCKGCDEAFRVPDADEPPRKRRSASSREDDRDEGEERPGRQKEKKGSKNLLLIGGLVGCGGLLVIGGAIIAVVVVVVMKKGGPMTPGVPKALAVSRTADPAKVNRAKYLQIQIHDKESELFALVGLPQMRGKEGSDYVIGLQEQKRFPALSPPVGPYKPRLNDSRVEILVWKRDDKFAFAVWLLEGQVEWRQILIDDLISEENFEKLQVGMTVAEVRGILGPPLAGDLMGPNTPFDNWEAPGFTILVSYEKGRLVRKKLTRLQ